VPNGNQNAVLLVQKGWVFKDGSWHDTSGLWPYSDDLTEEEAIKIQEARENASKEY